MPLSKERMKAYDKQRRLNAIPKLENAIPKLGNAIPKSNLINQPNAIPKCGLSTCVICTPERYQEWFKKTYGHYDLANPRGIPQL